MAYNDTQGECSGRDEVEEAAFCAFHTKHSKKIARTGSDSISLCFKL